MPAQKTAAAVRIARSLRPAELALNEAAIGLLTVGTEVLKARTSGAFEVLEGQLAVDQLGRATAMMFGAMSEMAGAHSALRDVAAGHQILSYGDLCPPPGSDDQTQGNLGVVTPLRQVG